MPPRTLLEELLQHADFTLEEWCAKFEALALELGEDAPLSVRQLQRWANGTTRDARSSRRRVAAALWGHAFSVLVAPRTTAPTRSPAGDRSPSPEALLLEPPHDLRTHEDESVRRRHFLACMASIGITGTSDSSRNWVRH